MLLGLSASWWWSAFAAAGLAHPPPPIHPIWRGAHRGPTDFLRNSSCKQKSLHGTAGRCSPPSKSGGSGGVAGAGTSPAIEAAGLAHPLTSRWASDWRWHPAKRLRLKVLEDRESGKTSSRANLAAIGPSVHPTVLSSAYTCYQLCVLARKCIGRNHR